MRHLCLKIPETWYTTCYWHSYCLLSCYLSSGQTSHPITFFFFFCCGLIAVVLCREKPPYFMSVSDSWKPEVEKSVQVAVAVKGMRNKKEPGRKSVFSGAVVSQGCSVMVCSLCSPCTRREVLGYEEHGCGAEHLGSSCMWNKGEFRVLCIGSNAAQCVCSLPIAVPCQ